MDTISRNDVLKFFDRDNAGKYWGRINNDILHEIWCDIKSLQPAEPKTASAVWIKNDNGTYSCSRCQSWIPKEQKHYARFCLHCGAKMEIKA